MSGPARKTILGLALAVSLGVVVTPAEAAPSCIGRLPTVCTFSYTGAPEAWVVPVGVTSAVFDLFGAAGGNFPVVAGAPFPAGSGGWGAHVHATLALTPGATLNMRVGGVGQDGGDVHLA